MQRPLGVRPVQAGVPGPNQVGLVVRLGDGKVLTRCVEFGEAEISGYEVLVRAGLQVVCQPGEWEWKHHVLDRRGGMPGQQVLLPVQRQHVYLLVVLASCRRSVVLFPVWGGRASVQPGDVEGWSWGEEMPPPVVSLEQICDPAAAATPVPTATLLPATATVAPTSTSTQGAAASTETPAPTQTATQTASPAAVPTATVAAAATATPMSSGGGDARARSNYVVFGVLMAVLFGAGVAIWLLRRRR